MTLTKNLFLYFFLRFLVFIIIPLSFLFAGCNNEDENKAMDEKISRLEKEAENHLRYKIQEQQSYFSKHKTFLNLLMNEELILVTFHQFSEHKFVMNYLKVNLLMR